MSGKRKILVLGKLPPPYMGPSVAFEIIINSGLKNRYELLHLDVKANETLNTLGKFSVKKIFTNLGIYSRLASILKKEKPELVLIPISQATLGFIKDSIFIIICWIYGRKVMIQLRGSNFKTWVSGASILTKIYVKSILSIPKGVIVLGQNLKYLFTDYFSTDRIFVVPNGGNYPCIDRDYQYKDEIKLLYLANLQSSKGIEDVLEAIRILKGKTTVPFSLEVIGSWRKEETKQNCLNLIESNALPVKVYGSEVSKQKFDFLNKADIFIFPPREPEGHPWVIVEAMAAGLPIISTDMGAIIESVRDGQNGYIVAPRQPGEIADKLQLLIEEEMLRIAMSRKSREFYLNGFTEEKMVDNFSTAFESVITRS